MSPLAPLGSPRSYAWVAMLTAGIDGCWLRPGFVASVDCRHRGVFQATIPAVSDALGQAAQSPPSSGLTNGERIADRYLVLEPLGTGGMGSVYRVLDEQLGEEVALKLLELGDSEAKDRFRREVRLARRITHVNVARTHDIGEHGDRCFLTMEYVAGTALDQMLAARGVLEREQAVDIIQQVARGLGAAHAAGVVHRDLKPANVLLAMPRAVVTDFGIARNLSSERITLDTQLLGTPHYMAPEQVLGEPADTAADIYALGMVLYECLTGTLPFAGDSAFAIALARCRQAPTDPRDYVPLPDALAELVLACLRQPAAERPTAAGVVVRLSALAHHGRRNTLAARGSAVSTVTPGSSVSSPFAPMKLGDQCLAVLPFTYRGSADHDYLADALSQELIDVLSRTRGLKVIGFGATQAYRDKRDPRVVGASLQASAVVDGTVQISGDRVRVSVRVLDSASGEQRWTERFERQFEDIFELQEVMAQRIADALRVELRLAAYQARLDRSTMDTYLRARYRLVSNISHAGYVEAADALETCIAAAPRFEPALAGHALACARAWWSAFEASGGGRDWGMLARESVERALSRAPEFAESHLAAAVVALQEGDLRTTAAELSITLRIAPTSPKAHRYLGELQCEAGRVKEGLKRLKLALDLDPTQSIVYVGMARIAALQGDRQKHDKLLEQAIQAGLNLDIVTLLRARQALWHGEKDTLRDMYERSADNTSMVLSFMGQLVGFVIGEVPAETIEQLIGFAAQFGNKRLASLLGQLATEAYAMAGKTDCALQHLDRISKDWLVDVAWLELCPALESLRKRERFVKNMALARRRAEEIWRV